MLPLLESKLAKWSVICLSRSMKSDIIIACVHESLPCWAVGYTNSWVGTPFCQLPALTGPCSLGCHWAFPYSWGKRSAMVTTESYRRLNAGFKHNMSLHWRNAALSLSMPPTPQSLLEISYNKMLLHKIKFCCWILKWWSALEVFMTQCSIILMSFLFIALYSNIKNVQLAFKMDLLSTDPKDLEELLHRVNKIFCYNSW